MRLRGWIAWTLLVFGAGCWAGSALGQPKPRMWADTLLQITAGGVPKKVALRVNDDHWEPGAEGGRHRHPGPTIIYVLDGELSEATAAGTTVLKAGQAVWRPAGHEHNVKNMTTRPARALAVHLDPAP